jgi:myo-inositol 2-dehydrogenase/D-chiro-inositol 1-dehydrogenase
MGKLGVALIGLGRAGQFHIDNLCKHPRATLLYVVDIDHDRATAIAETYNAQAATLETALSDPAVHAVIVATPTPTHFKVIMSAMAAKKAVLSEKPVGFTLQEIDEVYNEASKHGLPILCGFNRRFDRSWVKAVEAVHKGVVGNPQIIRSTARDSPVPTVEYLKTSHGFFHDSGVHDIDVINWIMKESPVQVFAYAHCYLDQIKNLNDVDTIVMSFKFENGCISTVDMSRKSLYGYDQRVEVFGDKGMVQVDNKPTTSCIISNSAGELHDNIQFSFPQRFEEAYYLEFDHFVRMVLDGEVPRVTHKDSRDAFIIAEAAKLSSEIMKPVDINYD